MGVYHGLMANGATIPAETDLLCENCGYVLNGLPPDGAGRCPECGKLVSQSSPDLRTPSAWEAADPASLPARFGAFVATSFAVLFRPTHFYRTLATRGDVRRAAVFAHVHWIISSLFLGWAAYAHARWFIFGEPTSRFSPGGFLLLAFVTYVFVFVTTKLAAWLTHWEASYRGIRLPRQVVERGMYYHAVHYLPVAVVAACTVLSYRRLLLTGRAGPGSTTSYLYVLCAEVVVAALYLFWTYWIGMRNMMYANR
jgi:hypothetical protein